MKTLILTLLAILLNIEFEKASLVRLQSNGIVGLSNTWVATGDFCFSSWNFEDSNPDEKLWHTCLATSNPNQNCNLTTAVYSIDNASIIFLKTKTSVRLCSSIKTTVQCRHKLKVFLITTFKNGTQVTTSLESIPTAPIPKSVVSGDYFTHTGIIQLENMHNVKTIQLIFNAKQNCARLLVVDLYYYNCPVETDNLLSFVEVRAPNKATGHVKLLGKCTDYSESVTNKEKTLTCYYNGSYTVTGSCHCIKGYTKVGVKCKDCAEYEFKTKSGNEACLKCGNNTIRKLPPRLSCPCLNGYYRENGKTQDFATGCYKPPGKPLHLTVSEVKSNSVYLTWKAPIAGSKPLDNYVVDCSNCPKEHDQFPLRTKQLYINITGLGAFANYTFLIWNENLVTNLTAKTNYSEIKTRTGLGKPGMVRNVEFVTNNDGSVTFTWDRPFVQGGPNPVYVFQYDGEPEITTSPTFTIPTGTQDKTYTVKIYTQVTFNGKTMRSEEYSQSVRVKGGISLTLAIGASIGVIIFIVIVLILAFCYWRRTHPSYLQVVRMEDGTVKLPGRMFPGGKLYVDPTTYNDVDDAVQEFAYELDRKDVKIGKLLGGGEFAEVYKGTLFRNGKSLSVAIKTLKAGASKRDRDDFLGEAAILGQFSDANVVSLEGVILKDRPNIIVLEFMSNGALDKYLQINDMQFTVLQLLGMARGVASGMKYLSELGFIHRDLAARNILVNEQKVCKVSDFGMSREIKVDETYDTQGGKIPVRWTAPEAIQFKKFTTASDVWSYGVLLWEIMSYGERPYWDWGNYDVLERLNAGYRLPPPMSCPKVIHDFMLHCWNKDRTKRPKFGAARDQLEKWIRNPDLLQEIASVITKTDENLDYTVLQTINKWLEAIGMSRYTHNFIDQGFATPRQILDLTLEDLEALGIAPIGHRKKVYKAIQNTKIQVEARHNSVSKRKEAVNVSKNKPI
ncbi:ephrin type-B receptor 1-B-like [Hydractinia symbiolongicarpus]|uniref:ephrin type-B receptor 1-B-like n=1 Tax=Hydractinia symbiolongicarpus TaxID=13093 RepID=UPI00254A5FE4|nr:ephrin type-B receptor 1-B-like [Hydractinia symbiolongicarpus]